MDFTQHVTQPTHNRGHTLDLVITHGLSTSVSSVVDLAVSDHYCVFFNITGSIQRETSVRTVRRRYLTSEVAANFTRVLDQCPPVILPAPCDFIFNHFNSKLKKSLDSVAPLTTKKINVKRVSPGETKKSKHSKGIAGQQKGDGGKIKMQLTIKYFASNLKCTTIH